MRKALMGISFFLVAVLGAGALAQDPPGLERRFQVIKDRIDHGMRDGTLTRPQVARLDRDVNQIEAMMRDSRADGRATKSERVNIRDVVSRVERDLEQMRVRR